MAFPSESAFAPALPVPPLADGPSFQPQSNNLSPRELDSLSPREIVQWALRQAGGKAVVSTNFRPYEAALLHLVVQEQPDIPVLWVDHGYNRPATYRHAEELRQKLRLNLKPYLPRLTAAHRDAIDGPVPTPSDEEALRRFSARMKLEPFQRGMRELAPTRQLFFIWLFANSPTSPCSGSTMVTIAQPPTAMRRSCGKSWD